MQIKLGDLLRDAGVIDELQLKAALAHQRQWGGRLGRTLVEMKLASEEAICDALASQLRIPSVRLLGVTVPPIVVGAIPKELCERHGLFPYGLIPGERGNDRIQVAMGDPTNLQVVDELRFVTGKGIEIAAAPESQIDGALRRHFYGESVADQVPRSSELFVEAKFHGETEFDLGGSLDAGSNRDIAEVRRALFDSRGEGDLFPEEENSGPTLVGMLVEESASDSDVAHEPVIDAVEVADAQEVAALPDLAPALAPESAPAVAVAVAVAAQQELAIKPATEPATESATKSAPESTSDEFEQALLDAMNAVAEGREPSWPVPSERLTTALIRLLIRKQLFRGIELVQELTKK